MINASTVPMIVWCTAVLVEKKAIWTRIESQPFVVLNLIAESLTDKDPFMYFDFLLLEAA